MEIGEEREMEINQRWNEIEIEIEIEIEFFSNLVDIPNPIYKVYLHRDHNDSLWCQEIKSAKSS